MTYSYQTTAFSPIASTPRSQFCKNTLKEYMVEIWSFDNEVETVYIEARTADEAAEKAQDYVDFDIYNAIAYLAA